MKKLSILIPSYNFNSGVLNILNKLAIEERQEDFEIIISDDSSSSGLIDIIRRDPSINKLDIRYYHNNPPLGAVRNWNFLIESAKGDFIWLIHHDEWPVNKEVIRNILSLLDSERIFDVLIMDVYLSDSLFPRSGRRHIPLFLKKIIIKYFSSYLLRRNAIGPTATLLIKRDLCPQFDVNLKWMVDVDFYMRILSAEPVLLFDCNLRIYSLLGRSESITSTLKKNIDYIIKSEAAYLSGIKGYNEKIGLKLIWRESLFYLVAYYVEGFFWHVFRVFYRAQFYLKKVLFGFVDND